MTLDDIKAALTRRSRPKDYRDTEFLRLSSDGITNITDNNGKEKILLVPMKTLTLESFTFPFSAPSRIAAALRLQVMPFSTAGTVEVFPVITARKGRGAEGIAWYSSPAELDLNLVGNITVWPAPLAFAAGLKEWEGSGVTLWLDEECACSLLWQNYKPVLYHWRKIAPEAESQELALWDKYCEAENLSRGGNFVVNAADGEEDDEEFAAIVSESVKQCSWIADVNLSRKALEGARDLERTVRLSTKAAVWVLGLGVAVLCASWMNYASLQEAVASIRARSENYYKSVFEPGRTGRVSNPVMLARDKIAEASGTGGVSHPLEEVFADLGEIFAESSDIRLDTIRYNAEGIDCTGTAPDQTAVLNFRREWEERGAMAQVDNTQFVSGIGYRFDLRVRWNNER